jgi:hypothetical protein
LRWGATSPAPGVFAFRGPDAQRGIARVSAPGGAQRKGWAYQSGQQSAQAYRPARGTPVRSPYRSAQAYPWRSAQ